MSAPDTNIEKQKERHKAPLFGMSAAVLWSGILLVGLIIWVTMQGNDPSDDQANPALTATEGAPVTESAPATAGAPATESATTTQ